MGQGTPADGPQSSTDSLRDIATPTFQQVLKLRRFRGELGPCALDSTNRVLYSLPSACVQRESFLADRDVVVDHSGAQRRER